MFATPLFDRAAPVLRRATSLLAVLSVLTVTACGDDDDGPSGPGGAITGTWELDGDYMRITSTEIQFFTDAGNCFVRADTEIVDRDGDVYTVEYEGIQFEFEISRSGDNLTFSDGVQEVVFESSNVNVANLEICTAPELPACNTLPEIEFNGTLISDLESSDPVDEFGAHYELFRIVIEAGQPDPVVIEMNAEFDAYLYVYDASGNIVAENDDWELGTTDSRIDLSEPDGCYIVKASSFDAGETGTYELFFF